MLGYSLQTCLLVWPDVLVIPDQDHDRLVIQGVTVDQDPDHFHPVVAEAAVEAVMVVEAVQDPPAAVAGAIGKQANKENLFTRFSKLALGQNLE